MTEQEVSLPHPVLQKIRNDLYSNEYKKASLFLQSIDENPTLLDTLRRGMFKQYCKYIYYIYDLFYFPFNKSVCGTV